MLFLTLTKKRLPEFLDAVDRHYRLIAPEQKGSKTYTFRPYSEFSNVALEFLRTIIPPRQFFFPPVEHLFSVDKECRITVSPEDEPFSIIQVPRSKLALHNAIAYAVLGFADGAFIPALDQRVLRPFGNPA
jgi:sulfhydrogenase subunit beta (sulfur reductase)